ncbi:exo-alpha-sialidase [Spongorhabdus nitratireducens]
MPQLIQPGEGCYRSCDFVLTGSPECHSSCLHQTADGQVHAVWIGGAEHAAVDACVWGAVYNLSANSWGNKVLIANGQEDAMSACLSEAAKYPCWDPVLYQEQEQLILFYKIGINPRQWHGVFKISNDNGISWEPAVKLNGRLDFEGVENKSPRGPAHKPQRTQNGCLICASSAELKEENSGTIKWCGIHLELLPSGAAFNSSWKTVQLQDDPYKFFPIHPVLLKKEERQWIMLCRSRSDTGKRIIQSISNDDCESWSTFTAIDSLPNPDANFDAIRLTDGRYFLVYNHAVKQAGINRTGRHLLNAAISEDALAWEPILTLEHDESEKLEYSYPSVIQTHDGLIHISYTWERRGIKHVTLSTDFPEPSGS